MTGRAIDQVLPHSCDPALHEPWVHDARHYRVLAEQVNGNIPVPADEAYIWGDARHWLERFLPAKCLINLETAVTCSEDWWSSKGIHYRMHPENARILAAGGIDFCGLANNHVLDWGYAGLIDTLAALKRAGLAFAGAGPDRTAAQAPAILPDNSGSRVIVLSLGSGSSGIPPDWAAQADRAGVWRIDEAGEDSVEEVAEQVRTVKGERDVVVASIHWGANWGYVIPDAQRRFARALIDRAGVDLVHGHSSHHPKALERYRGQLILYGCGDFLNDYEGIPGEARYRPELTLMCFPELDPLSGCLEGLALRPMAIRRFQVANAVEEEADWLLQTLNRESQPLGVHLTKDKEGTFRLESPELGKSLSP